MSREIFLQCKQEALSKRANEKFTLKNLLIDIGIESPTSYLIENVESRFRNYVMLNGASHFELIFIDKQRIFVRLTDIYDIDDI